MPGNLWTRNTCYFTC